MLRRYSGRRIQFHQLRSFIAVAEELNFTRAAERLGIAQPPLSLHIKQLEDALKVRLFDRSKHKVALTKAGIAVLGYAYQIFELLADAETTAQGISRGEIGQLKVAFNGSISRSVLPRILRAYQYVRPKVQLKLIDLSSAQQIDALERSEIDIAITRSPVRRSNIKIATLKLEPLCLVLPKEHPLARAKIVSSISLQKEPMIMCSLLESPSSYELVLQTCSKFGFSPNILCHITRIHSLLDLVAVGTGIAILPQGMKDLRSDDVVFRPIVDGEFSEVCIMHRTDLQLEIANELIEIARKQFESDPVGFKVDPRAKDAVTIAAVTKN